MTTVLKALITADATQMKTQLKAAEGSLTAFSNKATAAGKKLTKSVTLPMVAIGGISIKAASEFEASMTKIESLVGLSSEAVQGFEEDVKRLAGQTAQAPKDLADAMFFITSAGLRGAAATETLEAAAKAAAIGLGDAATVADLATSALNAYGEENISATKATDVMVAAVREGKLEASELAGSMGRVLPIASAMGVGFDEVGASFAALSRTGTNAAEAATQVRGILSSLLRPTKQAEDALAGMGLSAEGLRSQIREEGLLATLKTLAEEFAGNEAAAASVFGNIRALSGVMDLMGANVATTEQIFANMTDTTGALDKAFETTTQTAAFKLSQAMANVKQALIDLGNVLIPIVVPVLETLSNIIKTVAQGFSNLPGPIKTVTQAMLGMAAAAGPVALGVGKLTGKGGRGVLGGLLSVVKKHPVAFAAATVGAVAFGKIIGGMRKRAQEAKNRMEILRKEFIDSGDPTATLTERVKELASKLADLKDTAEEADPSIGDFVGSQTMLSELIKRDVVPQFQKLDLEMGTLIPLVEDGTDEFHKLGDQTKHLVRDEEAFIEALQTADASILGVTYRLGEQIKAGKLTTKQAREIMIAIDETADAFDDYRKALEKQAKEYLTSDQGIIQVTDSLGLLGAELLDAAGDSMTYMEAQKEIEKALQVTDTAINGNIGGFLGYNDVVKQQVLPVSEEVVESQEDIEERLRETEEALQEVKNQFDAIVDSMRASIDEAFAFDLAMIGVEDAAMKMRDAMVVLADEEATLDEKTKAVTIASQNMAESFADVAEAMVGTSAAEITDQFDELGDTLNDFKDTLPEDEFNRLNQLLIDTEQSALNLHGTQIMIDFGITGTYDPSMLSFLEQMQAYGGPAGFASSIANFVTPMATGGIVTKPQLSLIGEAGPEAVIPLDRMPSGGTTVNVTVQGNVMSEYDLAETIQNQLIRIKGRNASLEFV